MGTWKGKKTQKCLKEMYDNEGRCKRDFQHEGDPNWACWLWRWWEGAKEQRNSRFLYQMGKSSVDSKEIGISVPQLKWSEFFQQCERVENDSRTFQSNTGLPKWLSGKESTSQGRRHSFDMSGMAVAGSGDPLEEERATTSVFLPSEIPGTEEPGRLQSVGSQESDMTYRLNTNDDNKN